MGEESPYRRVISPKGTQLGFTEIGLIWTGEGVCAGQSTLIIEPTETVAKRVVRTKFRPMLKSTTQLSEIFSRQAMNGTLEFSSDSADVIFTGSNSATNFATISVPRVMGDEIDRCAPELLNEGDPVDLLENRIAEYGFLGKMFLPSSPTVEGVSIVWREWLQSDQRVFKIPCPTCGHKQQLLWEQMAWTPGEPQTAMMACIECGELSGEIAWKSIWHDGEWVATVDNPIRKDTVGFHLSTLYARIGQRDWAQLVQQFEAVQQSGLATRMQTFWNTILGLPWKVTEDAVAVETLRGRLESWDRGVGPHGVLLLTAGVDYQKNRLEVFVYGWGRKRERWLVDKVEIPRLKKDGTKRPSAELAADLKAYALEKDWPCAAGGVLRVEFSVHDSGDDPADVFDVLEHFSSQRACASKGREGWGKKINFEPPKIVDVKRDGKVVAVGRKLMWVNTAPAKSDWYDDLRRGKAEEGVSERYVHLPDWVDEEQGLLEQFVSEEVRKTTRGKLAWVKVFERNEALDCSILAEGARWQLKSHRWSEAEWQRRERLVNTTTRPDQPPPAPAGGGRSRVRGRMM